MPWTVDVAPREQAYLLSLPAPLRERIRKQIDLIEDSPYGLPGSRKLRGSPDRFRVRVGDYRIVYLIDEAARRVLVERIRHRREVYRGL
jgi:mRNA interferase RelE/StbE